MNQKESNRWLKHWDFMLLDLLLLNISYSLSGLIAGQGVNPFASQQYINIALVIILADICVAMLMESYTGIIRRGYFQEFKSVLNHVVVISAIEVLYLFLTKSADQFSRAAFIIYVVMSLPLLYLGRTAWKRYLLTHHRVLYNKKVLLLVTTSHMARQVVATVLNHNTYSELEIKGIMIIDRDDMVGQEIQGIKVVCTLEGIKEYIQTRWIDGILIKVKRDTPLPDQLITDCLEMGVCVHNVMAEIGENSSNQKIDRLGGYVVISTNINMMSLRQQLIKRIMDIVGAVIGLIITAIITLFLGPAIFIASPGPIFFSQERVGKNGRRFKIYKFRSMYMDAEERKKELMARNEMQGFMFKLDADPRIIGSGMDGTRHGLGWFIRKTSLDEFPQFWNILKGEMSLVGTRPPTVDEWLQYAPHHRARMAAKPGLTGLWQVSGRSNITDFEEVVKLDLQYIQNWNIGVDIKILLKTVMVVLLGRGSK